ncbi:hypothetical protein ACWDRR_15735 [Kitasatospora sp. NPDC003701]
MFPQPAVYLRCYPGDPSGMDCHRRAMERLALRHNLPEPYVYIDNGRRHRDGLPQLELLERGIANGWIHLLLIPGPFVFALDDRQAAATVDRLRRLGCRLIEILPSWSYRYDAPVGNRATTARPLLNLNT